MIKIKDIRCPNCNRKANYGGVVVLFDHFTRNPNVKRVVRELSKKLGVKLRVCPFCKCLYSGDKVYAVWIEEKEGWRLCYQTLDSFGLFF